MTREEIISRLVEANFREEVVRPIVDALPEEELQRMKDDTLVQQFKELVEPATKEGGDDDEDDKPRSVTPGEDGVFKCYKCNARMRLGQRKKEDGDVEIEIDLDALASAVADKLKEGFLPPDLEIEIPGLDERFGAIEASLGELKDTLVELAKSEEEKLARYAEELSPASKTRLKYRLSFKDSSNAAAPSAPPEKDNGDKIDAPDGQQFATLSEFMGLEPGE